MPDWLSFSSWHRRGSTVTHSPRSEIFRAPAGRVLQAMHVLAGTVAKEVHDGLSFCLNSHFSYLPPISPSAVSSFPLFEGMEVEMDGAVQSLVATAWHEQAIHSKIMGVEDRGRINNEVMDRLTAVWEKGRKCFRVLSMIFRGEKGHIYHKAFGRMIVQWPGQGDQIQHILDCLFYHCSIVSDILERTTPPSSSKTSGHR